MTSGVPLLPLGLAQHCLGARLDSAATARGGDPEPAVRLPALSWQWLDLAVVPGIAGLAVREGTEAGRGEECTR